MPFSSMDLPISGYSALEYSPISTPATPPSPAATNEVSMNRPSTLMPSSQAARGDSAMARSARPSWVFCSASSSTAISAKDRKMMPSSSAVMSTPPSDRLRCDTSPAGKRMFCAPKTPCTTLVRIMPTPMVAIIGIRCGAPRARKGRSTSTSISRPTAPAKPKATNKAVHSGKAQWATACSAA